jgi:hypothetical protein
MLALIGGQYAQDTNYVNGVVLSARKSCDRIALWTSIHHDQQLIFRIGYKRNNSNLFFNFILFLVDVCVN